MLAAVPHRHTHRGPFLPEELPPGLLAGLQNDALTEGATLALVGEGLPADRLARLAAAANRRAGPGSWRACRDTAVDEKPAEPGAGRRSRDRPGRRAVRGRARTAAAA